MKIPLAEKHRIHILLYSATIGILIAAFAVAGLQLHHHDAAAVGGSAPGTLVCGQPVLHSPFDYDGPAGKYASGQAGLPTFGKPGTDFPDDKAGMILAAGTHSYPSYLLTPDTVYYLLPGVHVGDFQADTDDAFVGGLSGGTPAVLSGNYSGLYWAIDSNSTIGDQSGVT